MMQQILNAIFGCRHERYTFPQTIKNETTVCCLACGARQHYDWQAMKITGPVDAREVLVPCPVEQARRTV